jgi:E3 ubiquitin-protein ligase SHPRH
MRVKFDFFFSSEVPFYMSTPTPLLCVEWWRICLDEAQMIEGRATRAAEMASKFICINR